MICAQCKKSYHVPIKFLSCDHIVCLACCILHVQNLHQQFLNKQQQQQAALVPPPLQTKRSLGNSLQELFKTIQEKASSPTNKHSKSASNLAIFDDLFNDYPASIKIPCPTCQKISVYPLQLVEGKAACAFGLDFAMYATIEYAKQHGRIVHSTMTPMTPTTAANTKFCANCMTRQASNLMLCVSCQVYYCEACFDLVHHVNKEHYLEDVSFEKTCKLYISSHPKQQPVLLDFAANEAKQAQTLIQYAMNEIETQMKELEQSTQELISNTVDPAFETCMNQVKKRYYGPLMLANTEIQQTRQKLLDEQLNHVQQFVHHANDAWCEKNEESNVSTWEYANKVMHLHNTWHQALYPGFESMQHEPCVDSELHFVQHLTSPSNLKHVLSPSVSWMKSYFEKNQQLFADLHETCKAPRAPYIEIIQLIPFSDDTTRANVYIRSFDDADEEEADQGNIIYVVQQQCMSIMHQVSFQLTPFEVHMEPASASTYTTVGASKTSTIACPFSFAHVFCFRVQKWKRFDDGSWLPSVFSAPYICYPVNRLFEYYEEQPYVGCLRWLYNRNSNSVAVTRSTHGSGEAKFVLLQTRSHACSTLDEPSSWFQIEVCRPIIPQSYALWHDASNRDTLRSWDLLASKNGLEWNTIRSHNLDTNLKSSTPFAHAHWKIQDETQGYRFFRIVQTNKNANKNHNLVLGAMEIYGVIQDVQAMPSTMAPSRAILL